MTEEAELPCAGKLVFETNEAAKKEAVAIEYRRGTKLKVYKCRHCGLWHLSSEPAD